MAVHMKLMISQLDRFGFASIWAFYMSYFPVKPRNGIIFDALDRILNHTEKSYVIFKLQSIFLS